MLVHVQIVLPGIVVPVEERISVQVPNTLTLIQQIAIIVQLGIGVVEEEHINAVPEHIQLEMRVLVQHVLMESIILQQEQILVKIAKMDTIVLVDQGMLVQAVLDQLALVVVKMVAMQVDAAGM